MNLRRLALALAAGSLSLACMATEREPRVPAGLVGLLTPAPSAAGGSETQGASVQPTNACGQPDADRVYLLRAKPGRESQLVGELRFAPERTGPGLDCQISEAWITLTGTNPVKSLPVLESSYEQVAVPVFETVGDWHRIAIPAGSAWVNGSQDGLQLDAYPALMLERLAYVLDDWDGELCAAPGSQCRRPVLPSETPLSVLATRLVNGEPWLQVEFTNFACGDSANAVLASGWIRAYGRDKRVSAWFYSRGC